VVRGGAREVFATRAAEVLIEGPTRTGKTRALLEKAHAVAMRYPGSRILLVRKTRASLSESVLQTYEDHILAGCTWLGQAKRTHRDAYYYPNGSIVVPGGMDHTDKIMSTEWDRIFAFEWTEATENDHEKCLTRLSGGATPFRQMMVDCNPSAPAHWLNQRANRGQMQRIMSRLEDNPRMHDGKDWTPLGTEYRKTLEGLTGVRRARLKEGKWAAADGLIYEEFDPSIHVIREMPAGWQSWRKYRAIDFGFNDPFVCLWIADSGEALYVYREWYMSRRITEDHARRIIQLSGDEQYAATVSDHARDTRETLHRHGVYTTPAEKDIRAGIDAVRARLVRGANEQPRIFFVADSLVEYDGAMSEQKRPTCLREEFDSYVWAKKPGDKGAKEEPYDADNHAMDALRYAVMAIDTGGAGGYVGVVEWD